MARTKIPTAREVMQAKVETIAVDAELEEAVRMLLGKGLSGAPVVDGEGALRGVLSEHDCILVLTRAISEGWPGGLVESHMTTEIETVPPTEDIFSISSRFARGQHRRLIVVEKDRPIGLISRRDLLRALESMEQELTRSKGKTTYELIGERHNALD
jgi:CBS domain-containing protein